MGFSCVVFGKVILFLGIDFRAFRSAFGLVMRRRFGDHVGSCSANYVVGSCLTYVVAEECDQSTCMRLRLPITKYEKKIIIMQQPLDIHHASPMRSLSRDE